MGARFLRNPGSQFLLSWEWSHYSYHLNDVKDGARCFVTRSDGEGKHTRRVALSRTLGFTNQLDTVGGGSIPEESQFTIPVLGESSHL